MIRSDVVFSLLFSVICPAAAFAVGGASVTPGGTGQIEFPIESDSDSVGAASGVRILVEAPGFVTVKNTGRGPADIGAGETHAFLVDFDIAANAPNGPFQIVLKATATSTNIDPDLGTFETSVIFTIENLRFIVGELVWAGRVSRDYIRPCVPLAR